MKKRRDARATRWPISISDLTSTRNTDLSCVAEVLSWMAAHRIERVVDKAMGKCDATRAILKIRARLSSSPAIKDSNEVEKSSRACLPADVYTPPTMAHKQRTNRKSGGAFAVRLK